MRAHYNILVLTILIFNSVFANSQVINSRAAVALNNFTLYPEASFTKHSNVIVRGNSLLEVIEESESLHFDNYQNQQFKWYKVNTLDGRQGFVFGDNIAIIINESRGSAYEEFHLKKNKLSPNFRNALCWIAELNGLDSPEFGNAIYRETYLIVSNEFNQCEFIRIGSEHQEGKSIADYLEFKDLTGDGYKDIILQTTSRANEKNFDTKYIGIYSFENNKLDRILDDRISVEVYPSKTAPVINKYFDIESEFLRVSYLDYVDCEDYCCKTGLKNNDSNTLACMEHVTYSYNWNSFRKEFEIFYEPQRTPPLVRPVRSEIDLIPAPGLNQSVGKVAASEKLKVYKQIEKFYKYGTTEYVEIYFMVETSRGIVAYVKSKDVEFYNLDHSALLNEYYSNPPFYSTEWTPKVMFVNLKIRE